MKKLLLGFLGLLMAFSVVKVPSAFAADQCQFTEDAAFKLFEGNKVGKIVLNSYQKYVYFKNTGTPKEFQKNIGDIVVIQVNDTLVNIILFDKTKCYIGETGVIPIAEFAKLIHQDSV